MGKPLITTMALCLLASVTAVKAATNEILGFIDPQKVVFQYENELRAHDNQGHPNTPLFYDHNDIQVKYLLHPNADVFVDYRLVFQDKGQGFKDTSMFLPGFNLKVPEGRWGKFNLRNRLEISLAPNGVNNTYYLNEFPKYNFPIKLTRFQFQPFVADESFWDTMNGAAFVKNRVYAGLDWQITPRIKGGTWYYWESSKGHPWKHDNVAVTAIRFEF